MNRTWIPLGILAAVAVCSLAVMEQPPAVAGGPIDLGDTAWLLTATGLVLLMTPGLAFFYGGMFSTKNVISKQRAYVLEHLGELVVKPVGESGGYRCSPGHTAPQRSGKRCAIASSRTLAITSRRHIAVAVGRDYGDAAPTRGVFRGGPAESLSASVRIEQVGGMTSTGERWLPLPSRCRLRRQRPRNGTSNSRATLRTRETAEKTGAVRGPHAHGDAQGCRAVQPAGRRAPEILMVTA